MNTGESQYRRGFGFGGRRRGDLPLSDFPAWGLDIMMGLYGPETVAGVCRQEADDDQARPRHREARRPAPHGDAQPSVVEHGVGEPRVAEQRTRSEEIAASPIFLELEAVNELARAIERRFRRHHAS